MILSGLFAALTAAGAFLKIPFYPVPFTLQTFFTALAGLALPPRWAAMSQLTYLIIGLMGVPVFALGGGIGYILQPTFGYLLLLPLSAYTISFLMSHTRNTSFCRIVIYVAAGLFLTLLGGALWLYVHFEYIIRKDVVFWQTLYSGAAIFLPSMILKAVVAGYLWKVLRKRNHLFYSSV